MTERIEQVDLELRTEQRLVVVRTMHVHQQFADASEDLKRDRTVVDQVLAGAGRLDDASDDKLAVLAGIQAALIENGVNVRRIG